ncbi:MAG: hypothetical protein IKC87_02455 [Clostridia bacterium]|nr:hypothetical protein [Clostridia bacterium]
MKKLISILLILSLALSLSACKAPEPKDISCEEIIAAYEDAGYSVLYHGHENDTVYNDLGQYCSFEIRDPDNEDNYMYVHRYFDVEDAKKASEEERFNPILWLFFGIFGEWRWLHTGRYGDLTYSTFDRKMIEPLEELMK